MLDEGIMVGHFHDVLADMGIVPCCGIEHGEVQVSGDDLLVLGVGQRNELVSDLQELIDTQLALPWLFRAVMPFGQLHPRLPPRPCGGDVAIICFLESV